MSSWEKPCPQLDLLSCWPRQVEEVIIIPIRDKTRDPSLAAIGFRTENGVTVINIDKSNMSKMPMLYVRFVPLLWNQWNILRDTWSQCTEVLVFTVLNVERSVYLKFFWMKTYRIYFHVIRQKNLDSSHVIWLGNKWQWIDGQWSGLCKEVELW